MSYICGTNINITIKCNSQNSTFEFFESDPEKACLFTLEEDLSANLDVPWYASSTGGTVTVTFEPASSQGSISVDDSISGSNVSVTEVSTHCYVISYSGSSEPSCDFEIWNPSTNPPVVPKPKVILLPKPSGPPTK